MSAFLEDDSSPISLSAYVHFPYCLKKCPYCDFNSYGTSREEIPHQAYADAVLREMDLRLAPLLSSKRPVELKSIFLGGGTPSLWRPSEAARVIRAIAENLGVQASQVEVSAECNPTSLDKEQIEGFLEAGINRFSVGVQSLEAKYLEYLGRLHTAELALNTLETALSYTPRVSADLMFGMPDQSPEDFVSNISQIADLGVEHISAYALTIEAGTQFGELHRKGRLPIAKEDAFADTYLQVEAELKSRGFGHYEVSNYAKPGGEARHNQHYWRGLPYLGLGAGAVGCLPVLEEDDALSRRYRSHSQPKRYLDATEFSETTEDLLAKDVANEFLLLGLRTREGVDLARVQRFAGIDLEKSKQKEIEQRVARGELEIFDGRLRVPPAHWLMLDSIVLSLFS